MLTALHRSLGEGEELKHGWGEWGKWLDRVSPCCCGAVTLCRYFCNPTEAGSILPALFDASLLVEAAARADFGLVARKMALGG